MWPYHAAAAVFGYLLGSFPTGYLVGRSRGIDIREHGSGNIGATNVVRVLGKKPGYFVFFCDVVKALLAVLAGGLIIAYGQTATHGTSEQEIVTAWKTGHDARILGCIVAGLACILGHNFPVWLGFRGGKGVATTIGVAVGLMPTAFLAAAAVWFAVFYFSRYVSLASMLAAASLPVSVWLLGTRMADPLFWFALVAAVLIVWRHRTNIQRLANGTEPRFARKKPSP